MTEETLLEAFMFLDTVQAELAPITPSRGALYLRTEGGFNADEANRAYDAWTVTRTIDEPLGNTAFTGAVDTVAVLKRKNYLEATLHIRGRDVEEKELALTFDAGLWNILGPRQRDHNFRGKSRHLNRINRTRRRPNASRGS